MEDIAAFWDEEALAFDEEPDHGLRDRGVREAWTALLAGLMPAAPCRVADLGCGTGTLSVLLAQHGYQVTGIDLSPKMIELARQKARAVKVEVDFQVGDVCAPPLQAGVFDVVLTRHVLWALPERERALGRWVDLLDAGGRLVLIEGRWSTGAGLTAAATLGLLRGQGRKAKAIPICSSAYWGHEIDDERYVVVSPPDATSLS